MGNKFEITAKIAHDYLQLIETKNGEQIKSLQIPIETAQRMLTEVMRHDYLQEEHTKNYTQFNHYDAINIKDCQTFFNRRYEYPHKQTVVGKHNKDE